MCELSDEDVRWKPSPDRFSVAEVLAHLSHSEAHCYRARPALAPDAYIVKTVGNLQHRKTKVL